MSGWKNENLLAGAALTLWAGLSAAWLAGWPAGDGAWPLRLALLAGGVAVAAGVALLLRRQRRRERRLIGRHLEALCRIDPQTGPAGPDPSALSPLPADTPWRGVLAEVGETVLGLCRRIEDVEQARTSLEVRWVRAAAEAQRVKNILAALSDPILAIDGYDRLVLANPSAEELFQLGADRAEAKALADAVHCQRLVQLLTSTRQRKTAGHRTDELEITDGQGRVRWYRATAQKLTADGEDGPGPDAGAVAVLRDVGDQKTLQKRNAEFVSSVSHEMKTPLAGIKAYVELLADGDAEDEQTREEFLGVINGQADRLQRLVDNLLNLARIEAGVVQVSKQPRSLNELLEEALRVVQPSAESKQIRLRGKLSPLYLGVLADRDMLLQAAINLLSNAVKYTLTGGTVTLRSRLADDQVRFEVQDTGVGLSEEDLPRVFEKFYRVKKDKQMAAGTGLGLPLAKHIVEDVHGGRLTVESVLGQGSTFIVTLPGAGQMRGEG
jgi:two-component system phosphate regulon sensor histidine kinase PhoR